MTKVKTALEQKQVWGVTINLQKFSMASPDNTIKDVEKYVQPPTPQKKKKKKKKNFTATQHSKNVADF